MTKRFPVVCLLALLGMSASAQAEEFASKTGRFVKDGGRWLEYPAFTGPHNATFTEIGRSREVVAIFDATRNMIVRLPLAGGMATWNDLDQAEWQDLAEVSHTP